jgi:alkaline phosphatase D
MKIVLLISCLILSSCSSNILQSLVSNEITSRAESNYQFSILQGTTDSKSTVIRFVYPNFLQPIYEVYDSKNNKVSISSVRDFERKAFEFKVSHVYIENLSPNESYRLEVKTQDKQWKDTRHFKTLKENNENLRVLVASCMSDSFNEIGNQIWPKAFSHNPDVVFLTGDNLYADVYSGIYIGSKIPTSVEHLWRRHIDHAMLMKVYRMKKLVPTFTTWDDHDFGLNNGDKSYKNKVESAKIFKTFFPTFSNEFVSLGKGVGSSFKFRGNNFLFLDARSFRDGESKKNGFHFGTEQRDWIKSQLSSGDRLNWLISGDQFFGAYHPYESFEGLHPTEFKKFVSELKGLDKRYAFMSGDRHLVEVMKISEKELGKTAMEYTVSGMHTKMYPGSLDRDPNTRRVDGFDGEPNYAIFDIKNDGKKSKVQFRAFSLEEEKINRTDQL